MRIGVKPMRAGAVMRSTSGFTLVETIVVIFVIAVGLIMGLKAYEHYKEQSAFSGSVRELTHAITVARVRAMQSQTMSRLVLRPAQHTPDWKAGQIHAVGDIVNRNPWTYRCITAHTSVTTLVAPQNHTLDPYVTVNGKNPYVDKGTSYGNEPGVAAYWNTVWEIIADYQYNSHVFDVQHCTQCTAYSAAGNCTTVGTCTDASPYNATTPVSIQFDWTGVPVDYIDHYITVQGVSNPDYLTPLTMTVTSMGKIKGLREQ